MGVSLTVRNRIWRIIVGGNPRDVTGADELRAAPAFLESPTSHVLVRERFLIHRLRRILIALFPPPRKRITWRAGLSLAIFAVLFSGTIIGLEYGGVLLFARPAALGLSVFAVWVWWLHVAGYAGLPPVRGEFALWTRLLLLALLAMVLAEPRAVRQRDVVSAMFMIDVSDSVRSDSVDAAIKYVVDSYGKKPTSDQMGLMVFGKTPAVELPPRPSFPFEALNSQVDHGATNVEQALSLAAAMLADDHQGRLVIVSDGVQTEGNLSRVLDDLKSRGIAVDVLPIDYSYDKEVWLERLDLPQQVKLGETYEAAVVLSALQAGHGKLTFKENGQTIAEQPVTFQPGKNRYTVPLALRAAGYYEYTATIEVDRAEDSLSQNNSVMGFIFVEGEGRLLLVTDPAGSLRDWQALEKTLQQAERTVEVITADAFPAETPALMPYDCIIFCNVPYDAFEPNQLAGLKDAVYNVGIGFLMVGGGNSFGAGGWHRTVAEDILPVTMDISNKKVLPKGALAIILHTCEFPEGNTWAKRITKQAMKVLSAQDEVGVLAYTEKGEDWIFELTPAGKYEELAALVAGAFIGDMPSFQNTMQLGLAGLKKSDAATKHMIIISDGDPSPAPPPLLQEFVEEKISVSTVAVFPHGGMEQQSLQAIAGVTGGRYYLVNDDPERLPSIFIKESKTLKRSMVQNKEIAPQVGFPSPVLKGIDGIPNLRGYVITNAKPAPAMTVLQAPPEDEDPGQQDPLLVIWQHGLGKTAAFTSDLSPRWAADWQEWEHYQAFVKQLIIDISRTRRPGSLRLSSYANGGEAVIVVEDFHAEETFLDVSAKMSGPAGKSEVARLKQIAPRRYQASVPLWGHGRYHIAAQGKGGERDEQAFGGFIVPYSPEYLRFRSNRQTLSEIANRTGGRVLSGQPAEDDVFQFERVPRRTSRPVFDWFLIALAILVPIDVAIRRIQFDGKALWKALTWRKASASTVTMGTLLERKQQVQTVLQQRREERPQPTARTVFKPIPPQKSASPTAASPTTAPPAGGAPLSTTERLVKLKKQREEETGNPP